jgi:hypothetical protein
MHSYAYNYCTFNEVAEFEHMSRWQLLLQLLLIEDHARHGQILRFRPCATLQTAFSLLLQGVTVWT